MRDIRRDVPVSPWKGENPESSPRISFDEASGIDQTVLLLLGVEPVQIRNSFYPFYPAPVARNESVSE